MVSVGWPVWSFVVQDTVVSWLGAWYTHDKNEISTPCSVDLHARHQRHLEDVLGVGRGVAHGDVEGPVDAEGHLAQVALGLLAVAVVGDVDVREDAMEVQTRLLAWNTNSEHRPFKCKVTAT